MPKACPYIANWKINAYKLNKTKPKQMKQTLLAALVALTTLLASAQDAPTTVTKTFQAVADTYVRDGGNAGKNYNMGNNGNNGPVIEFHGKNFYGFVGFAYQIPEGMKVQKAEMHFVTERTSGNQSIYGYDHDFDETTATYNTEKDFIGTVAEDGSLELVKIDTPKFNGSNLSTSDVKLGDDFKQLDKWQNTVDVTDYLKTVGKDKARVNFLFSANGTTKIYTHEISSFIADVYAEKIPAWLVEQVPYDDRDKLVPYLEVAFVEDADNVSCKADPIADTWIRQNNKDDHSKDVKMEIKSVDNGNFYGLMEYKLPAEVLNTQEYEINSVTLRLFHPVINGDKNISIYAYPVDLKDNCIFADEESKVNDALAMDPIVTYTCNGSASRACDKTTDSNFLSVESWTNYIDLTDYVKGVVNPETRAEVPSSLAFLFKKNASEDKTIRIATKEAKDIVNTAVTPNVTFAAEDIKPYMMFSLTKRNATVGIQSVVDDANVPVEYYSLSGVKVSGDNMAPGIYVRRQGSKTTKILVK